MEKFELMTKIEMKAYLEESLELADVIIRICDLCGLTVYTSNGGAVEITKLPARRPFKQFTGKPERNCSWVQRYKVSDIITLDQEEGEKLRRASDIEKARYLLEKTGDNLLEASELLKKHGVEPHVFAGVQSKIGLLRWIGQKLKKHDLDPLQSKLGLFTETELGLPVADKEGAHAANQPD